MDDKVRMRALKPFSNNYAGSIVTGHPEHPMEEGRYPTVTAAQAIELEDAGDAERYSHKDQARDEARAELEADQQNDDTTLADENAQLRAQIAELQAERAGKPATPAPTPPAPPQPAETVKTAGEVRDRRTDTSAAPKPRGRPKGGGSAAPATGGNDTTASTNHPNTASSSEGGTTDTNSGANEMPDSDAAPR